MLSHPDYVIPLSIRGHQLGRSVLDYDPGDHGSGECIQQGKELLQLIQPRIGDVDDVLIDDGEALGEKIATGVAEVEAVDDRSAAAAPGSQGGRVECADDIGRLEPQKDEPGRSRA